MTKEEKSMDQLAREVLIDMINSGGPPAFILGGAIAFAENQGTPAERDMARALDAALKQWLLDNPRKDLH